MLLLISKRGEIIGKIIQIRSDNGLEFKKNEFVDFGDDVWITHKFSA